MLAAKIVQCASANVLVNVRRDTREVQHSNLKRDFRAVGVEPAADVPSPPDFRVTADAREWAETAMANRREDFFRAIADNISSPEKAADALSILELGSGPGFLARYLLDATLRYTRPDALDKSQGRGSRPVRSRFGVGQRFVPLLVTSRTLHFYDLDSGADRHRPRDAFAAARRADKGVRGLIAASSGGSVHGSA